MSPVVLDLVAHHVNVDLYFSWMLSTAIFHLSLIEFLQSTVSHFRGNEKRDPHNVVAHAPSSMNT